MAPVALAVSPHPDDELLGAPAALMALRDAGWRIVNLACSLGRAPDRERRRAELEEACRRAGFELVFSAGAADLVGQLERLRPGLILGPSPHDNHHAHELAGRTIRDAVEASGARRNVMFWGLWGDLPMPNVLVPFGAARMSEIQHALSAHAGELTRNRYDRLLVGRAQANAVLGPERVFGFGTGAIDEQYAELLMDVCWSHGRWLLTAPRQLDPAAPTDAAELEDVGWWMRGRSVRELLRRSEP